jgi:hypothetical protein
VETTIKKTTGAASNREVIRFMGRYLSLESIVAENNHDNSSVDRIGLSESSFSTKPSSTK